MQVDTNPSAKLALAATSLATLTAESDALAAAVIRGDRGAEQKFSALRKRIVETETSIGDLQVLLKAEKKADERKGAEARHESRLAGLAALEAAVEAKNRAAADYCRGAEIAQKAFTALVDASHRIANALPAGTKFPAGFSAHTGEAVINGRPFPSNLESLASAELYRHCGIDRIGKSGAMPGAKALSQETIFDPAQIEPLSKSTARINDHLLRAVREQVEFLHRSELEQIEVSDNG